MKKSKASILATSLIIMGVMIVIALGISFSALQSRKSSIGSSKSSVAFQNADSGVEVVMQKIKNASAIADIDPASDLDGCNGIVNSSGKYKVELKKTDGTSVACGDDVADIDTIKSTGYSSQDSRAIEVAVAQSGSDIYQTSCADDSSGLYCCRINQNTGAADCKRTGTGNPWVSAGSPFSATGAGRYNISCHAANVALYCCRTDAIAGTVTCRNGNGGGSWANFGINAW